MFCCSFIVSLLTIESICTLKVSTDKNFLSDVNYPYSHAWDLLTNGWEAQFWGWVGEEEECWDSDREDGGLEEFWDREDEGCS